MFEYIHCNKYQNFSKFTSHIAAFLSVVLITKMLEICIQTSYDQNVQLILKSYFPVVYGTTLNIMSLIWLPILYLQAFLCPVTYNDWISKYLNSIFELNFSKYIIFLSTVVSSNRCDIEQSGFTIFDKFMKIKSWISNINITNVNDLENCSTATSF